MNCHDALRELEVARPGSGDRNDPDLAEAAGHLGICPRCRRTFRERQRLDRRIGRVMRQVPVPAGLRERLLQSLFAEFDARRDSVSLGTECPPASQPAVKEPDLSVPAADATPASSLGRRWPTRRRVLLGMAAAAALISGIVFLWPGSPPRETSLTLADVRRQVTLELSQLEAFDGNFSAKKPGGSWKFNERIRFTGTVKGDLKGEDGRHRVALYEFRFHGGEFRGVLLVMPKRLLADPPSATYDLREERPENYARRPSGNYHTFAWTSERDGLVYICFIRAGAGHRKALEEALSPQPA